MTVIMLNDYPQAAYTKRADAEAALSRLREADKKKYRPEYNMGATYDETHYWRLYEVEGE